MAIVFPIADSIGTGIRIGTATTPSISNFDMLLIDNDISIVSTNTRAINNGDLTNLDIVNYGLVAGTSRAIEFYRATSTFTYDIYNGETGRLTSQNGYTVYIGSDSLPDFSNARTTFVNAGEIAAMGNAGAVFLFKAGLVTFENSGRISSSDTSSSWTSVYFFDVDTVRASNSGTITGAGSDFTGANYADIAAVGFGDGTEDVVFRNSGTITAPLYSIGSDALVSEVIVNSGTLNGSVAMSDTIGGVLQNSGAIFGDVLLRDGANTYRAFGDGFVSGTVLGGAGNDTLIGASDADALDGGGGDDRLFGMDGDDTLLGGAGNDTLYGGSGEDLIYGGTGADLIYGGPGDDILYGEAGRDTIYGNRGDDLIFGGQGADEIYGGGGNDIIFGGFGNNLIYGGPGDDEIYGGSRDDTIFGGAGDDVIYGGAGDDMLYGQSGDDIIYAVSGDNTLYGGQGDDVLHAGTGQDIMYGGAGADVFVWTDVSQSAPGPNFRDTVMDFESGLDRLDLSALMPGLTFIGIGFFSGTAGEVRFAPNPERLFIDTDGNGSADFAIDLNGVTFLDESDLIL